MGKKKVVILGSSATRIDLHGGSSPTGNYLNETVVPAMALMDAGYEVVLATPTGKKPHIDEPSDSAVHFDNDEAAYDRAKAFWAKDPAMNSVRTIRSVVEEGLGNYSAIFVPGGQAPVVDLMQDADVREILQHFHKTSKPTALLCHGPITLIAALPKANDYRAALVAGDLCKAKEASAGWIYAGYKMTVFSATEEKWIEDEILHAKLYFDMPFALTLAGGYVIIDAEDFAPNVVIDRELITGQNPRSDHAIAAKLIEKLNATV